uniref:Glucan endo-1,3-beta-glucosidase 1 n=1 Tax=Cajanus cajan TaxID=3821 RepID=A0A151TX15_CAJCA|nr:Glucan endo-1,3-beta-glucosidase 1 [Cajanus cajan]
MTKETSLCLLFLSFLIISSSGTKSSSSDGTTFLHKTKISNSQIRFSVTDYKVLNTLTNTNLSVDFFLNESLVENFVASKSSVVAWLEAHLINILPQLDIRSIIVSFGSERLGQDEMPSLTPVLKSIHSFLSKLPIRREIKLSVAFPLSFIENLNASHENDLLRIVLFMKKIDSFIMIEDNIEEGLSIVQSVIERATLAAYILPCKDVPVVLTIKSQDVPSSMELSQFSEAVSKYLEAGSHFTKRIVALYAQVHTTKDFVVRELIWEEGEEIYTPTIITVPSTNPVTVSPTNPGSTPITVPSTTPVAPLAPTNPVTNPVTSYPPPSSGSVPVTSSIPPPSPNTNVQTGQSWCVAKTGVPEASLQSALDYACGMPSVDCSQIQQGASCYNPNSLQNHASFAFNSYYQKNPAPTSCDFGGTANIVNTNPSSGSCVFPSSSGAGTSG